MNFSFLSDLHYEHTSAFAIQELCEKVKADKPDAVAILGDLGSSPEIIQECAKHLSFDCPVGFVAGNHDIWSQMPAYSSERLFREFIPGLCVSKGWTYLEDGNLVVGDITVVGSLAWYDYSAVDPKGVNEGVIRRFKAQFHNDHKFINLPYSDIQFADMLRQGFTTRLRSASTDRIVVVTHVPILEEQMIRNPSNPDDGIMQAMYGNLTMGNVVRQDARVELVMSGHTHKGVFRQWAGVVPSEYGLPKHITITMS